LAVQIVVFIVPQHLRGAAELAAAVGAACTDPGDHHPLLLVDGIVGIIAVRQDRQR
jgi:hypothetical protein